MTDKIGCQLQGLPKDVETEEILAYFSSLRVAENGVSIVKLQRHRKSSSALVAVPNKNTYKKLATSLRKTPFQGRFLQVGKAKIPSSTKDNAHDNTANDDHALAEAFHKHLCHNPNLLQQASDRGGTHEVFQAFYADSNQSKSIKAQQQQRIRMEALMD